MWSPHMSDHRGFTVVDANPSIDETPSCCDEVRKVVTKLKGGKAAVVCNISENLFRAGGLEVRP